MRKIQKKKQQQEQRQQQQQRIIGRKDGEAKQCRKLEEFSPSWFMVCTYLFCSSLGVY